jgi:hypothetical protein
MKWTVASLAVALAVAVAPALAGQDLLISSVKDGKQRITTIDRLPPVAEPVAPDLALARVIRVRDVQPVPKPGSVRPREDVPLDASRCEAVCLTALDWQCGRYFTDELGRRWYLIDGLPWSEKPATVSGTLVRSLTGRVLLITDSGRIYATRLP